MECITLYRPGHVPIWEVPYLQRGEVLMRYETLYYQPRKKPRNICDPASSNHHNSGVLHGKNNILGDIIA